MSQALSLRAFKKSYVGTLLKKVAHPILPGWVDAGRLIVQGPHLRELLKQVTGNPRTILNAGAGEGLYSSLLLDLFGAARVLELDASYNRCSRNLSNPRQRFMAASLTDLPLADQSVHLILCSEVLEHIPEDEQALRELSRVLSNESWLLISVPTPPAVFDPAHVREGYSEVDLTQLLERNGLEVVEVRFCMHAIFRLFLKSYRGGWVPRGIVFLWSWLDRLLPFGKPMDLMVLARKPTVAS